MAARQNRSVIVIDDEELVEVDNDLIILDHGSPQSQEKRPASKPHNGSIGSPFRDLDWTPKTPRSGNMTPTTPTGSGRASRILFSTSEERAKSCTLSLSPTVGLDTPTSMVGTAGKPIDLLAGDSGGEVEESLSTCRQVRTRGTGSRSFVPKYGASDRQQYILLDDDDDKDDDGPPNALARSLRRFPTAEDELIDLEEIEDELLQADGEVLLIEDAYLGDVRQQDRRRSFKGVKIEPRNPKIVFPFMKKETLKHMGSTLVRNKTVELRDGSFLRIKDIILNGETKAVTLRGHHIQRTRDMNGMLEKKMNECLLFLEVDVDDHRDPLEQAVVDAPLAEVVQLRNVRYTNEQFPINRNMVLNEFNTKEAALEMGGLTTRWKYTCRYTSAISRYHNRFKERSLERLLPDECSRGYSTSNAARRFKWRGETVPGGAYRPTIDREEAILLSERRQGRISSTGSSQGADGFAAEHVHSINDSTSKGEGFQNPARERGPHLNVTKRKHSQLAVASSGHAPVGVHGQKKLRRTEENSVEEAKEGISRMSLQPDEKWGSRTNSKVIDLSSRLPVSIDLTLTDLATPPNAGSIQMNSRTARRPILRSAGQRLTFGDAFCGAGGTTRGATMAGLRALWGFDHWDHACETWRANFPYATCHQKDAHKFVQFAKSHPNLVKVDILHLSPPCQFFSPAHTIEGRDDEMNTASLFAVMEVIQVSKPRIVTLEQTFGICHPRFMFYFNALIHMFTAQDFSIRWAIVPLAQWGLPARRMRLIIIAACPGEILPKMPCATHSELGGGNPSLKPFTSVQSALSTIPRPNPFRPDPLHDLAAVAFARDKYLTPWDATKILPRAMTTSGGGNWHPSGKRDFTLREYATLQGFPPCHVFKGKSMKKQIGNAVPACIAKVLFESIRGDLDAADGVGESAEMIED